VMHLGVRWEPDGRLVYERTLRPGTGAAVYGLEVCRGLGLDAEFMARADAIRRRLQGVAPLVPPARPSRYNARLRVDTCALCRLLGRADTAAAEVHHIRPQRDADADGFIGPAHKNRRSNLLPVCAACHDRIHAGAVNVHGYVQTTGGVTLHVAP
jgi:DNA mismatch repair protein MutS